MRRIGRPKSTRISLLPSAQALRDAALHQQTAAAFVPQASTGIAKGVYRFKSHEEADTQRDEALARVIADNATRLRRGR